MSLRLVSTLAPVLVGLALNAAPHSQPPTRGTFQILGAGAKSCETWTKEAEGVERRVNLEWVLGYVTSISQDTAMRVAAGEDVKPLDRTDAKALGSLIDKYCEDRPTRSVSDAAHTVLGKLGHQPPMPTPPTVVYK